MLHQYELIRRFRQLEKKISHQNKRSTMPPKIQKPTEGELEILSVLWELERASVKDVVVAAMD